MATTAPTGNTDSMAPRRSNGELEESVLQYLWAVNEPATPADVHAAIAPDLAYTTVMTVLTRLFKKGLLDRARHGRAYAYRPVEGEAMHRAEQMHGHLGAAGDRDAVLSSFIDTLSAAEAAELRRLLKDR